MTLLVNGLKHTKLWVVSSPIDHGLDVLALDLDRDSLLGVDHVHLPIEQNFISQHLHVYLLTTCGGSALLWESEDGRNNNTQQSHNVGRHVSHSEKRCPGQCKRKGRHVSLISNIKQADKREKKNDDNKERDKLFSIDIIQH